MDYFIKSSKARTFTGQLVRFMMCAIVAVIVMFTFEMGTLSAKSLQETEVSSNSYFIDDDRISPSGKVGNGNDETPGEWYVGDPPENPLPNAPVLLFVPGLNNVAQVFWEDNDMRETARAAGYQTTFVQLNDAGGASADMWDNGVLLAEKIEEISEHFNGKPITIIAYSKGGVDTQTALTYYGASDYVENVITLSSPHHGSQLADLAYSSWAGWLADLIGAKGDGTYSMQTGNMEAFRSDIDNEPLAYEKSYYTLGGTKWDSAFSSNWFGGTYLSQYGANDGVVTAASSALPGGNEVEIGEWSHTTIRTGETFPVFEDYLSGTDRTEVKAFPGESVIELSPNNVNHSRWIYGGEWNKNEKENVNISIENDVESIKFDLLTSESIETVQLMDPKGNKHPVKIVDYYNDEGVFAGSYNYSFEIDKPVSGEWTLVMNGNEDNSYLLVADYEAPKIVAKSNIGIAKKGNKLIYDLATNSKYIQSDSISVTMNVSQSNNPTNHQTYHLDGKMSLSQDLYITQSDEVYNITTDIEGLTKQGKRFTRTTVDSVYVE